MIGTFSRALSKLQHIDVLLGERVHYFSRFTARPLVTRIVGWGLKNTTIYARSVAEAERLPFLSLEDGFLRSVGLGNQCPPLSIVIDDLGVYYDCSRPSRLETLIAASLAPQARARAFALVSTWRKCRVSKYNHLREYAGVLPDRYVLVADQTFGDASIAHGQATAQSFQDMLAAALAENPDCTILIKIHPDVFAGRKRGHFDPSTLSSLPRVEVLVDDVHPVSLIEHAEAIYVVTSQVGFEGLLWGKRVRTFGMPFYAGWGLTEDTLKAPLRRKPVMLENLVHAALITYPRYLDPESLQCCTPERLLTWMGLQRSMRERFPAALYAVGFSFWKKAIVRDFFQGSKVNFVRNNAEVPSGACCIVWGMRPAPVNTTVIRLEDGFLRSVGLGVDLVRPLSWVQDKQGIYYDAMHVSDLEQLLNTTEFDVELLERSASLRQRLVSSKVTKYNIDGPAWQRPAQVKDVVLVVGQVETDASLAYGAPSICRNIELLKAVRQARPTAYVLYKPHPDVVAGLRKKGENEETAESWCDELLLDNPMGQILDAVDEVHVLTSLAGFEALLRGKKVVVYAQPFYSGWGLTEDRCPTPRRCRSLRLDELVAGALLLYPAYVSLNTRHFTTAEGALSELLAWRQRPHRQGQGLYGKARRIVLRTLCGVK